MQKMDNEIKIVIADDHQMFIDGVKSLLSKEKKLNFVHEAANAEDALLFIRKNEIDLLITEGYDLINEGDSVNVKK